MAAGKISRVQQHQAEDDRDGTVRNVQSDGGADHRANGGGRLQKHADADVGIAFAHIGGRRTGRGGNHRNQRRADGIADVDMKQQRQHRHNHHAAAQAR